jgi:hypothetical protein
VAEERIPAFKLNPPILGTEFIAMLRDLGFISDDEMIQRVIIDAPIDNYLVVHVQRVGDVRLLNLSPLLQRQEVTAEEKAGG